jgi:hypothetical protein
MRRQHGRYPQSEIRDEQSCPQQYQRLCALRDNARLPARAVGAELITTIPADNVTVTDWYKQNVNDPSDNKIGEIMDVLVDRQGKASR